MKKTLAIIMAALIVASTCFALKADNGYDFKNTSESGQLSVVTFNCAAPWGGLINNTLSSDRVKRFSNYMNSVSPDLIGTQEMNKNWLDKLSNSMSDYDSYGVIRGGDDSEKTSEMNALFWKKDKFKAIKKDTFWLSDTPDTKSKYKDAGCYRICSYVVLADKNNKRIVFMNTHLDNSSSKARELGANLIKTKAMSLMGENFGAAVVITGDFNDTLNSNPVNTLGFYFTNTITISEKIESTYQDWGKEKDTQEPIDFIFTNSTPVKYQLLDDLSHGYVSDHYGVFSIINYQ